MGGIPLKIPGQAGIVEAKAARLAQAARWHWNVATVPPIKKARWQEAPNCEVGPMCRPEPRLALILIYRFM